MTEHIAPFAAGLSWDGVVLGKPPWKGTCCGGVHVATRIVPKRGRIVAVTSVFSMDGITVTCGLPAVVRCQLFFENRLLPFWWLACADAWHRQSAGIVEHLDAEGFVHRAERLIPEGMSTERQGPPIVAPSPVSAAPGETLCGRDPSCDPSYRGEGHSGLYRGEVHSLSREFLIERNRSPEAAPGRQGSPQGPLRRGVGPSHLTPGSVSDLTRPDVEAQGDEEASSILAPPVLRRTVKDDGKRRRRGGRR